MVDVSVHHFDLRIWEVIWYCVVSLVGMVGNFLVCFVILRSGAAVRNAPFNMLLMSLAVADFLIAAVVVPNYVLSTSEFDHPKGKAGERLCKGFTGYVLPFYLALVSVYSLVAISIERLRAVTNPIRAYTTSSSKRTCIIIVAIWLFSALIELPTVLGIHFSRRDAAVGNFCYYDWKSTWIPAVIYATVFSVQFIVPFFIFTYSFYKIRKSFASREQEAEFTSQATPQQLLRIEKKKRTVRIVFLVIIAFFVCWTPNNVMYFLFQYAGVGNVEWNSTIYQIGILIAFTNSCINPFLYSFQSEEFRRYCSKAFRGFSGRVKVRKASYKLLKDVDEDQREVSSENAELSQSTSERVRAAAYPL